MHYNNKKISNPFMSSIITFIFLYFLIFFILAILLSLTGLEFVEAVSGAATAISNVGPGLGDMIGPNGNFNEVSDASKWILSFGMILGRLEIFAILFANEYFCEIFKDNLVSGLFLIQEFFNKELLIPKKNFSFLNFKFTFYKFYFF